MSSKLKLLQLQILDNHLNEIRYCARPSNGWINSIRKALGMSLRQMSQRIGITQQAAAQLETHEAEYTITLKSLRKVAEALNCRLVYALIPNEGSLQTTIEKQAFIKAQALVSAVDHTMTLEDQGVGNANQKIAELTAEFAKEPNSKLWEND